MVAVMPHRPADLQEYSPMFALKACATAMNAVTQLHLSDKGVSKAQHAQLHSPCGTLCLVLGTEPALSSLDAWGGTWDHYILICL